MAAAVLIPPAWRASREDGIPYRLADSHSGHSDAGQIKAQDAADGAVRRPARACGRLPGPGHRAEFNIESEHLTVSGWFATLDVSCRNETRQDRVHGEFLGILLAIIGKRIFLDFRRPATGHANLVSGVGSAEMDRSSG